jgi:predicted TIM-barrel fold metal-dependent hydrolase
MPSSAVSPVEFFDCDVLAGLTLCDAYPGMVGVALLGEMARCGISRALIYTHAIGPCAWEDQNRQTRVVAAAHRQLVPCAVLPQHGSALGLGMQAEIENLLAGGFRCFRLDAEIGPASGPLALDGFAQAEAIWGCLAAQRAPVFIPGGHLPDRNRRFGYGLPDVIALCHRHPALPVVLLNAPYALQHQLALAMESAPNLHLVVTRLGLFGQLEAFVRTFGGHRFLFGSGFPANDPAIVTGLVRYADLSPGDCHRIAAGNLHRLLTPP